MSSLMLMAFLQSFMVLLTHFWLSLLTGEVPIIIFFVAVDSLWHSKCVEFSSSRVNFKLVEAITVVKNREMVTTTKFMLQFLTCWHWLMGPIDIFVGSLSVQCHSYVFLGRIPFLICYNEVADVCSRFLKF